MGKPPMLAALRGLCCIALRAGVITNTAFFRLVRYKWYDFDIEF
jgi:hypothetical protein